MADSLSNDMLDLLRDFTRHKVEFLIVGAHAVNYFTDPRATKDLDVWINPTAQNAENVYAALRDFGAPLATQTPADFCDGRSFFIIGVKPNRVDILQSVPGVDFASAWVKRENIIIVDVEVGILALEHLIAAKSAAGRPQDLADLDKLKRVLKKQFPAV